MVELTPATQTTPMIKLTPATQTTPMVDLTPATVTSIADHYTGRFEDQDEGVSVELDLNWVADQGITYTFTALDDNSLEKVWSFTTSFNSKSQNGYQVSGVSADLGGSGVRMSSGGLQVGNRIYGASSWSVPASASLYYYENRAPYYADNRGAVWMYSRNGSLNDSCSASASVQLYASNTAYLPTRRMNTSALLKTLDSGVCQISLNYALQVGTSDRRGTYKVNISDHKVISVEQWATKNPSRDEPEFTYLPVVQ
ncbi:hypothetical protein VCO01S_00960 [Vibrio comitans NBRC 102076]|uniref:Uncharacterized protein n=2 Tax=Vibrio comitans TaxID=413401 RepID=A0A4Y3IHG1_9VIBR|nr:hypothetical protein VCO01S_00960 [Vibrio comitans NBRC 102076]